MTLFSRNKKSTKTAPGKSWSAANFASYYRPEKAPGVGENPEIRKTRAPEIARTSRRQKQPDLPSKDHAISRQNFATEIYQKNNLRDNPSEKFRENGRDRQEANFSKNSRDRQENNFRENYHFNQTLSTFRAGERELELSREKARERRARKRKLTIVFMGIGIFAALVLALASQFSVGNFAVVAPENVNLTASDQKNYQKIIAEYFASSPLERFSFARNNANLQKFVAGKAPEISEIKIKNRGLLSATANLTFREPLAQMTAANQTNFVDASGVVFAKNFLAPDPAKPILIIDDQSGAAADQTSTRFLAFVGQVAAGLAKNGLDVEKVVIPPGAIRFAQVFLTSRNYPFLVQIDREPTGQAANIVASVRYLDARNLAPEYVDVRVAGKMFWK